MGENAQVELDELRSLADRITSAATDVTDLRRPDLDDGLPGSAVSAAVAVQPLDQRIVDIAAGLRDWATAARQSADALEQTDRANADRFPTR